jgi:hypothetical protein
VTGHEQRRNFWKFNQSKNTVIDPMSEYDVSNHKLPFSRLTWALIICLSQKANTSVGYPPRATLRSRSMDDIDNGLILAPITLLPA